MEFTLNRFNMEDLKDDKVVVLIGKRETGKSFLCKDILYRHRNIPVGTVISGTEEGNGFYGKHVPKLFIHNEYNTAIVENVMKRQKQVLKQMQKEMTTYKRSTIDPRTFMILDDCLYDSSWAKDKLMRLLFMNGRHWKIMLIITMQYPLGIPPNLRTNIDYVFILRENIVSNRKRIYDNYAGMFPTFEVFCQVMDQCTENYECLVINNNAKSNKLTDQVFWYKAEPHDDFRICSQQAWDFSEQNCSKEENNDYEGGGYKNKVVVNKNLY